MIEPDSPDADLPSSDWGDEKTGEDGHPHLWTNADPELFTRRLRRCVRCEAVQMDPDAPTIPPTT